MHLYVLSSFSSSSPSSPLLTHQLARPMCDEGGESKCVFAGSPVFVDHPFMNENYTHKQTNNRKVKRAKSFGFQTTNKQTRKQNKHASAHTLPKVQKLEAQQHSLVVDQQLRICPKELVASQLGRLPQL